MTGPFIVKEITAGYGVQPIIFDVSITCQPASITAIIGPNGAGKSTLFKAIFGVATIYGGSVVIDDEVLTTFTPSVLVRKGVQYVPQTDNVFPSLTVKENLEIGTYVRQGRPMQRILDLFPDLATALNVHARKLSGGQRSMLAVGRALISDPQIMLLDEPSGGLSPIVANRLWATLADLAKSGVTIVVVEQNVKLALQFSDYAYLLASGRNKVEGTAADFASRFDIEEIFFEAAPDPTALKERDRAVQGGDRPG